MNCFAKLFGLLAFVCFSGSASAGSGFSVWLAAGCSNVSSTDSVFADEVAE